MSEEIKHMGPLIDSYFDGIRYVASRKLIAITDAQILKLSLEMVSKTMAMMHKGSKPDEISQIMARLFPTDNV